MYRVDPFPPEVHLVPRVRRATGVVLLVLLVLVGLLTVLLPPGSARAHSADPRVQTVVDAVAPALPPSVVVQAQPGIAAQLVVDNPTPAELEVLGLDGTPFLRISAAGVFADVGSRDFRSTSSPSGSAGGAPDGRPARWVLISTGSAWGWYDHRLHPAAVEVPDDVATGVRLAEWEVPLRYDGDLVAVRGHLQFRPLLGAFVVAADPGPEGLQVQALPGRLPGVVVTNPDRRPLTVLGRDGEPFVRFGPEGVEVNEASRTHVEDRQARGDATAGPPGPTPRWRSVDARGTTYAWLDGRLTYPAEQPPVRVLRAGSPTVVDRWQVPVLLGDVPAQLAGDVTWVPLASAAVAAGGAPDGAGGTGPVRWSLLLPAVALLALAGAVVLRRRRRA